MRFELTQALDTIERRLTTDVALAQAVVDLGAVARFGALDGGVRAVNLLRTGMLIDALVRHLGEGAVMIYPVAGRELLSDQDLSSKERMVLGRWLDDGLVEVVPSIEDRPLEVADLTGLPVALTHPPMKEYIARYPWLQHRPDRVLRIAPSPTEGVAAVIGPVPDPPAGLDGPGAALLGRQWACRQRDCPGFGERRLLTQGVPRLRSGVPMCPRHDEPLVNVGARGPARALAVQVDGGVRVRFAVRPGTPVVVGRLPDDPDGIMLGPWLAGEAARMVSRNHVRVELTTDGTLIVTDSSTNGTVVRVRSGPFSAPEGVRISAGGAQVLGRWDTVELYDGVEIGPAVPAFTRSGADQGSVLADAPTVSFRPPQ